MRYPTRRCLVLAVLATTWLPPFSYGAEKRPGKSKAAAATPRATSIPEDPVCNFDFMNYRYSISDHTAKTTGIPHEVALRNGQASLVSSSGRPVDIGVTKITYGELTGDNAYEAVVRMSTIIVGSEYGTDDLYVFRYASGTPELLGIISEYDMDLDYLKNFPGGVLSHGLTGVKIHDRVLEIEKNVERGANEPKYNVRLSFRYENGKFVPAGVPVKVPYREFP